MSYNGAANTSSCNAAKNSANQSDEGASATRYAATVISTTSSDTAAKENCQPQGNGNSEMKQQPIDDSVGTFDMSMVSGGN